MTIAFNAGSTDIFVRSVLTVGIRETCHGYSRGRGVTNNDAKPQYCNYCGTMQNGLTIWTCSGCRLVKYCNKACQRKHWLQHKAICTAVQTLNNESHKNTVPPNFVTHLTPKQLS